MVPGHSNQPSIKNKVSPFFTLRETLLFPVTRSEQERLSAPLKIPENPCSQCDTGPGRASHLILAL